MTRFLSSLAALFIMWVIAMSLLQESAFSAPPPPEHPYLLMTKADIAQVKEKVQKYEWAAKLMEKQKALVEGQGGYTDCDLAVTYALTGERKYADRARGFLLNRANDDLNRIAKLDLNTYQDGFNWDLWSGHAWAYDLVYDTCSPEERQLIEKWMSAAGHVIIDMEKKWTTSRNLVFNKHIAVGLMGFAIGDKELIEWGLHDPGFAGPPFFVTWGGGGLTQVLDTMIKDRYFWGETPIYALHYDLWGMLALAIAAKNYDGSDYFAWRSKVTGASIKDQVDGYIREAFPLEHTGIGAGAIRMAMYGDGSTWYRSDGTMIDSYLTDGNFHGTLEVAYKYLKDPGYAWLISLNPNRDTDFSYGRSPWRYVALTHGEPLPEKLTPPAAPCGVYREQGFAMIRADESPNYWTSGSLSALVMLNNYIGHGHNDYFSLVLHGKGRLLYPDINVIQYEPGYLGWTRDGIAHSTLLVDGQNPEVGESVCRNDFNPEVKYFAISGTCFPQVTQTRAMLMTKEYLADVFHAADAQGETRMFDWVLHGLGRLYPGNPGAYRPTAELVPYYWAIAHERGRSTDAGWQMDWIQRSAGIRPGTQMGKEWFEQQIGVRMSMLGAKDTGVYYGDGGLVNGPPNFTIEGNPEGSAPMLVARRFAASTTFAAIHEPYDRQSYIRQPERLAENAHAVAMAIHDPDFTDYMLLAFDDSAQTLVAANGEAFTFSEYGYFRFTPEAVIIRGKVTAFRVVNSLVKGKKISLNGKSVSLKRDGEFATYGKFADALTPTPAIAGTEDTHEHAAYLHSWIQPEEIRVSAEGERVGKDIELHLRCVGQGEVKGQLAVVAPEAISVEPTSIDVAPLREGEERVVTLRVRSTPKAVSGTYALKLVPEAGLQAAVQQLPVYAGVVITKQDRRTPNNMQAIVRAPGYTISIDYSTGMPTRILDADGNRRYGAGTLHSPLLTISPLDPKEGRSSRCDSLWFDKNVITALTDPRTGYRFSEDQFTYSVVAPTNPYTVWVVTPNNFLSLKAPVTKNLKDTVATFYPPVDFRQGLLVIAPQPPVDYKGKGLTTKVGQEIIFRFATEEEYQKLGG